MKLIRILIIDLNSFLDINLYFFKFLNFYRLYKRKNINYFTGEENNLTANAHVRDFSESLTQGLHDSTGVHLIHTAEPVSFLLVLFFFCKNRFSFAEKISLFDFSKYGAARCFFHAYS